MIGWRMMAQAGVGLALTIWASSAIAQRPVPAPTEASCARLATQAIPAAAIRLPTGGARITSATFRPAAGAPGTPDYLPDYCDVRGEIAPVDRQAPVITFGVALPLKWNGNAIQIGGNGLLGFVPWLAALNRNGAGSPLGPASPPNAPYPLARGYATYGDDSGHSNGSGVGPGAPGGVPEGNGQATIGGPPAMGDFGWARNREAWLNFAHQHIRKGHDAALAVMRLFYGGAPKINYFMGESHGGREAMEAAGRYPEDYDGVLASVPLTYLTETWVRDFRNMQALAKPGAAIPPSKNAAIEAETIRQCDALDGSVDGFVANYHACDVLFDPALHPHAADALRCPGGADSGDRCLSDAQLAALNTIRSPTRLGYTVPGLGDVYPASPAGSESMGMWLNGRPPLPPGVVMVNPAEAIMRATLGDPALDAMSFSPDRYRDALRRMSDEFDPPTDWSRFFARGGKVIVHSATNDYLTNARTHAAAVAAIERRSGAGAATNLRFYATPGGDHGSRNFAFPSRTPLPRQMDLVSALEAWVEQGKTPPDAVPQMLMATRPPYAVSAARPLCRYPNYPRLEDKRMPGMLAAYRCAAP